MSDTVKISSDVSMIAHRGVSGLERENTNAAFVAAGNRSYFGIETDVHCTSDHRMIIIRDDTTDRVAGVSMCVEETAFDQLRQLRLCDLDGNRREDLCLPSLEEYIRICKKYDKVSVLEIKNHFEPADIDTVIDIIRREQWLDRTVFISFDLPNMICLREKLPRQQLQYLVDVIDADVLNALKTYSLDIDARYKNVTADQVAAVHALGQKVNVWTVNEKADAEALIEMGVDYITSSILE